MNFYNYLIASSSNMGAALASSAVELQYKWGYAIQASWSGVVAAGQLNLRGSNDFLTPTTWTNITGTTAIVSGPGTVMWNSDMANYKWVQMVFSPSSSLGSTGSLTAIANIKGF